MEKRIGDRIGPYLTPLREINWNDRMLLRARESAFVRVVPGGYALLQQENTEEIMDFSSYLSI